MKLEEYMNGFQWLVDNKKAFYKSYRKGIKNDPEGHPKDMEYEDWDAWYNAFIGNR